MRHSLCGLSIYGLNGLGKGDEDSAYTPLRSNMTSYTHSSGLELLEVLRTTSLFALRAVERLADRLASSKLLPLKQLYTLTIISVT